MENSWAGFEAQARPDARIEEGFALLSRGETSGAARCAERVLVERPGHAGALNLSGLASLAQGASGQAVSRLERATASDPQQAIYHANLGAALRAAQRPLDAAEACRRALALRPGYATALVTLGAAHYALENFRGALDAYDRALESRPDDPVVHAYRGDALRELGRVKAAVTSYERALALDPDQAHAAGNLGLTLLGVGEHQRALELCERACRLAPHSADAWMNLGTLRRREGLLDLAMEAYGEAHDRSPTSPTLKTLVGNVWAEIGELDQAAAWYRQALALEPEHVETRCALAAATLELGDAEAAIAQYRDILADCPDKPQVHLGLAEALWQDGDASGAVEACRRAVALAPEDAGAHARLATILASAGDVEGANAANRDALGANPHCVPALSNLAQNLRGKLPMEDVHRLERLLEAPWARDGEQSTLHFGLAHYYDGAGDHARAGVHAEAANASHWKHKSQRGWHYDPAEYSAHVDRLIDRFTPEFFAATRGFGDPSTVPVFIVGMPRSGTTLTEAILAKHTQVFGAGERRYTVQSLQALPPALGHAADADPLQCLDALNPAVTRQLAAEQLARLRTLVEKAGGDEAQTLRIIDKMPDNYSLLGWIATVFPNARIIHCRRDVRDVAVSCWMTCFKEIRWASDQVHLAERINDYRRMMAHWRQALPIPMLEVDYEALVADQSGQTRRLLEFLDLPWESSCLRFQESGRLVRTASVTQVRQPIYRRSVARWRHYESMLAPLLERIGEP